MATIDGTIGNDFIHEAGDGLVAPPGYTDIALVTDNGDIIRGTDGDDIIHAGDGTNTIYGGLGTDQIFGGANADLIRITSNAELSGLSETLDGGGGENGLYLYTEGGSLDLTAATITNFSLLFVRSTGPTPVHLLIDPDHLSQFTTLYNSGGGGHLIELASAGSVTVDSLNAMAGFNFLGSSGSDDIEFSGSSALGGNDFDLGAGDDTLILHVGHFYPTATLNLNGGDGNDVIASNYSHNVMSGGAGNDRLQAGSKQDTLDGGTGKDRLDGGGKADLLTGGDGADRFIYGKVNDSTPGKSHDTITDFRQAQGDLIDLSRIDSDATLAGNQAFNLGGAAFTHAAGELIQRGDGHGHTLLQADVNGDGVADFEVLLLGAMTLTSADFML